MNFIAPQNLAFGFLLGAILLLYILRMKRLSRTVASTMLWRESLRDLQANAPWQKLRSSLLMWLQLAVVALAVLALSRPAYQVLAGGGQTLAIVLDASASMNARDVTPSRFDKARAEAGRLINELGNGDQGALIVAGRTTQVLAPLTGDKNALKRALANAQVQDARCDLREAIVLASSLLRNQKPSQVVVLSDGAMDTITAPPTGGATLQWVRVGERDENVAITAMDAARPYARNAKPQVFVTVSNFGKQARSVDLELARDERLVAVRKISVPAATKGAPGTHSELFDNLNFNDGLFRARFDLNDDLAVDNFAFARLEAPQKVRVLLLSAGNGFLERALELAGAVELTRGAASDFAKANSEAKFDVVVCDGVTPPPGLGRRNLLVFRAIDENMPVTRDTKLSVVAQPTVVAWQREHPVTRAASWNDLKISQSVAAKTKSWGVPIVESIGTPLIVAGTRRITANNQNDAQQRVVWCGFDVRDSDLPLKVAFPIFITNAVRWLAGTDAPANADAARRAGAPVVLPAPQDANTVSVILPDGSTQRVDATRRPVTFDGGTRAGAYVASAEGWKYSFGLSLLDKSESDLQPRDALKSDAGQTLTAQSRARSNRELWAFFALAALALMAAEWWVFHRGA